MRLVEFYKELQSILEGLHLQEIDADEASEQITNLKVRAIEAELNVSVNPNIVQTIQIAEDSYNSFDEDEDGDYDR